VQFEPQPAPGIWRPTPPGFLPMTTPWLGRVTPLLVRRVKQFAPPPPPSLTSRRYTRDFEEVKAYGSADSTVRTDAQTATARFFTGNAFVLFNGALRDQAAKRRLDMVDAARMFAAADMAVADSVIISWWAKLRYGLWRPITAIQLADTDGNPATTADPNWTPWLVNPPYPEYTSGYNSISSPTIRVLENLFGRRDLDIVLISPSAPGEVRRYDTARALRAEVVDARVFQGIHFRFANLAARDTGIHVADWALDHYFKRVERD
jgi:hypothetical protein